MLKARWIYVHIPNAILFTILSTSQSINDNRYVFEFLCAPTHNHTALICLTGMYLSFYVHRHITTLRLPVSDIRPMGV